MKLFSDLLSLYAHIEDWFDHRLGWFFTNGNKEVIIKHLETT